MIETVVSSSFKISKDQFTPEEIRKANRAVDLLSRIKSTDHAEMVATVLFSYEELENASTTVKDIDLFNHVLRWKRKWAGKREDEVTRTIQSLNLLGWISPALTNQLHSNEDELY